MWIGGGVLALFLIIHFIAVSVFSPARLIDKFETAIQSEDSKALANLLKSDDKKLKIDDQSVKGLLAYYKKNPDEVSGTVKTLKTQLQWYKKNRKNSSELGELASDLISSVNIVNLEKDGKFLFYDKYRLTVPAVYLVIETNYKDTELRVDGKKVGRADQPDFEGTFGPFVPGYHQLKAVLKNDYLDLSSEKEVLLDGSSTKETVSLHIDAEEATFYLPNEGSEGMVKLYINGKDTGINLLQNPTFGPVLLDGSMTYRIEAELPWGVVKTEDFPIEDTGIDVDYLTPELQDDLMETVHNFIQEKIVAYVNADKEKITTATDEVKDYVLQEAETDKEWGNALRIKYLSTQFDLDSFQLIYDGTQWVGYLQAESFFLRDKFAVGGEPEMNEESDEQFFQLVFDENRGKWLVSNFGYAWYFGGEHTKELKAEEPKEYTSVWATQ